MTIEECWKIIYIIKTQYPSHYSKFTEKELDDLAKGWHLCLEEFTYDQVSRGLKAYLMSDTKGFPPVVGQVIEQMNKLDPKNEIMGALEAWDLVYKAICNSAYNSEAEFAKLPPLCQSVLGNPSNLREMALMDMNTVKSVEQSHFIRQYDAYARREQENMKLPPSMRIECQRMARIGGESYDNTNNKQKDNETLVLPDMRRD